MKHLVVLTGAGMSAESGLKTFRDSGGLWEGHDVMAVASPEGFRREPALVLDFYNQRRRQLHNARPNDAHQMLAALEERLRVSIVTQNVDDLHERAGSSHVLHLHGELFKVQSTLNPDYVITWKDDLNLGDTCPNGGQLRPYVVWFGESVPMMEVAIRTCLTADILLIIGTSLQVYPAAGLMHYSNATTPVYYIDPNPALESDDRITVIADRAVNGLNRFIEDYLTKLK